MTTEQVPQKAKAQLDAEFSDLYRAHLRDVYSYAYYRVGDHHDAEDLTEQTFLQAYRHFERAQRESDGRPLRPWLIRIAHNLAAIVGQKLNPVEHAAELVAPLHELLGGMRRRERCGLVDRPGRLARAVAIQVGRKVVGDPDQPWPQGPPVGLALGALEVAVGLQERLLGQVLGIVVVSHAIVGVAVDVAQMGAVEL